MMFPFTRSSRGSLCNRRPDRTVRSLLFSGVLAGLLLALPFAAPASAGPSGPGGGAAPTHQGDGPSSAPQQRPSNTGATQAVSSAPFLLITFDGNGYWAPSSLNLYHNLVNLGYDVTH